MPFRIKLISPKKESYYFKCGKACTEFPDADSAMNRQLQVMDWLQDPNPLRKGYLSDIRDTEVEVEEFKKE